MKKGIPVLLALLLLLSACGRTEEPSGGRIVTATTYPVYLFTGAVLGDLPGYELTLMLDQPMSCLHDYTLTVKDMKALERADVLVLSGGGLEETMSDALAAVPDTPVIDSSAGIQLLPAGHSHTHLHGEVHEETHGHDHEEGDPHIWMDPRLACGMIENIAAGLSDLDPDNAGRFAANARAAEEEIQAAYPRLKAQLAGLTCRDMITFHDGFTYFAQAFDLEIVRAIEEEAGSEASARDVTEIVAEIAYHDIPAIFTEKNGATATAEMISRECGVKVAALDLMMSGEGAPEIAAYLAGLAADVTTIQEAYS